MGNIWQHFPNREPLTLHSYSCQLYFHFSKMSHVHLLASAIPNSVCPWPRKSKEGEIFNIRGSCPILTLCSLRSEVKNLLVSVESYVSLYLIKKTDLVKISLQDLNLKTSSLQISYSEINKIFKMKYAIWMKSAVNSCKNNAPLWKQTFWAGFSPPDNSR